MELRDLIEPPLNILMQTASPGSLVNLEAIETARRVQAPWFGRLFYFLFPYRRKLVLKNIRRVYGSTLSEKEVVRLAQAYYAHFLRFGTDFLRFAFMSEEKKKKWVRVENVEIWQRAYDEGKGSLMLIGHFGSWETVMALALKA